MTLQEKDLLAEVSNVTKLAKIVKKTFATTYVIESRCLQIDVFV
jgi:hypothetical protein